MAFQPSINACVKNTCKTLSVTDNTGVYDASTNTTGWQDPLGSTLLAADVDTATLDITFNGGTTFQVDVTSQIPDPVTGTFDFNDIDVTNYYADGIATIVYTITDNNGTDYIYTYSALFTCKTRACIDEMWAEVACKSCGGSCDLTELIDDANLAEGLLRGLEAGAVCCDAACVNKILTAISQLCNWNNCNC